MGYSIIYCTVTHVVGIHDKMTSEYSYKVGVSKKLAIECIVGFMRKMWHYFKQAGL